jgi:hypothetical protein
MFSRGRGEARTAQLLWLELPQEKPGLNSLRKTNPPPTSASRAISCVLNSVFFLFIPMKAI